MKFKAFVAATVAVAALSVAAPASALTLTFQIDVTGSSAGAPTLADFQETWTFNPTETSSGPYHRYRGTPGALVETPVSDDLIEGAGLVGQGFVSNYAGASTISNTTAVEFFQSLSSFDFSTSTSRNYSQSLGVYSPSVGQTITSYDDAGLVAFILAYGPLTWSESSSYQVGGIFEGDPPATIVFSRSYSGTATLVAVNGEAVGGSGPVPEPATWALMILGFGSAGAMLRRRSSIVPA